MSKIQVYYPELIINFYKKIKFSSFKNLTSERAQEIDDLVAKWWSYFHDHSLGFLTLVFNLSQKLTVSSRGLGLKNGDEIFYFYVKMLDPSLVLLEIYEISSQKEDLKKLAELNFGIYDPYLLKLEKLLNQRFVYYKADDLWDRDTIRR